MQELISFRWPVDSRGYEIVNYPDLPVLDGAAPDWIRPLGGRTEYKRPLAIDALHREFADVDPTAQGITRFACKWGLLRGPRGDTLHFWRMAIEDTKRAIALVEGGSAEEACEILNRSPVDLKAKLRLDGSGTPVFTLEPANLFDAIRLQLMKSVAVGTLFRQCEWCAGWFAYGLGTQRRSTARFCSDRCRKAAHLKRQHIHGG